MAKRNSYDPVVDFDAKVNEEGKTLRDEINEAMQIGKMEKVDYSKQVDALLNGGVEAEMFNYIESIDKSAYAEITDNQKVTKDIVAAFRRDTVFKKIQSADQVQRLQSIFTEHLDAKNKRAEITAKEQAGQPLTPEERAFMGQKTSFETYMDRATKTYFMDKILSVDQIITKIRDEVLFTRYMKTPQKIKQAFNQNLHSYRVQKFGGVSFKFYEKDVSPILNDDKALDQYIKTLVTVREKFKTQESALALQLHISHDLAEAGENWKGAANRYHYMTVDEAVQHFKRPKEKISQYEYDKENVKRFDHMLESVRKKYDEALKNFHEIEAYVFDHPELRDYMESPEYLEVMKLEYHEGTYEGKSFSDMKPLDQQNYVLDKYGCTELRKIPREHREAYSLARDKKAQEELGAMEDKFKEAELRVKAYWGDRPMTKEMEIQQQELLENRAIIDALRDCITNKTPESEAKYAEAINKAYANAKQRYIDNPDLRDRMELRSVQIGRGDFSFVPINNREAALAFDMLPVYVDESTRFSKEDKKAYRISRENSFLARAYSERIKPLVQPTPKIQIENERQSAPDYTLKDMARGLDELDLEAYKADIANRRMEKLEYVRDEFSVKVDALKEQKDALSKQHGFFGRLFNSEYRASVKEIDQKLKGLKEEYTAEKNKARYDILKTYAEKGLSLTRAESRELNSLVKNAAKTGNLGVWDQERAEERRKIDEYNRTFEEQAPVAEEKVATTTQLDLGEKLHKPKVIEQPTKEAPTEKVMEQEKAREEQDIER